MEGVPKNESVRIGGNSESTRNEERETALVATVEGFKELMENFESGLGRTYTYEGKEYQINSPADVIFAFSQHVKIMARNLYEKNKEKYDLELTHAQYRKTEAAAKIKAFSDTASDMLMRYAELFKSSPAAAKDLANIFPLFSEIPTWAEAVFEKVSRE